MKTQRLTRVALMVALSYLGSYLTPFPGIVSTAALDSMPGFFSAVWLSPIDGCIIGAIGHFFTALLHGFPLSLPVHIVLTMQMGLICYVFGVLWKKSKVGAIIVATLLNGVASPLSLVTFAHLSFSMLWAMVPSLIFASALNIFLAAAVAFAMQKTMKKAQS